MIQLGRKDVIGLDIGTTAVKVVQLERHHKHWTVIAAGIVNINKKGNDSPSRRESNTQRAIHDCVRLSGVRSTLAVCAMGGADVAVRGFDFPALEEDEIDNAVLFEARQVCPFSTTDLAVDFQICSNAGKRTSGYLVASTNQNVRDREKLLKKGRLDCVMMDVEALALLNCFCEVEKPRKDHGTAVLNIGGAYTTLAIQGDDEQPFVRNINFGTTEMLRQLASSNDTTAEKVYEILTEKRTGESQKQKIAGELAIICEAFIAEVGKTVRYYSVQQGCFEIRKVLLCGGGALFNGIADMLSSGLGIEVEQWNPLEKMQCKARILKGVLLKNLVRNNGPAMAIAAGLARRTI